MAGETYRVSASLSEGMRYAYLEIYSKEYDDDPSALMLPALVPMEGQPTMHKTVSMRLTAQGKKSDRISVTPNTDCRLYLVQSVSLLKDPAPFGEIKHDRSVTDAIGRFAGHLPAKRRKARGPKWKFWDRYEFRSRHP